MNASIPVEATITDFSAIPTRQVVYRVDGGAWTTVPMDPLGNNRFRGLIPGQPLHSEVDFYIRAVDIASNTGLEPPDAPQSFYSVLVIQGFFVDDFETDKGWVPSLPSDTYFGRWARWAPWGTRYEGQWVEPPGDHSPFGTLCYETGEGEPGGPPGNSDVFGGCVTLTSPSIDLSQAAQATVSYWRWFARMVTPQGSFTALVSSNGGAAWTSLETLTSNANNWTHAAFDLGGMIHFTGQVQFRFITCNPDQNALVKAVDDFEVVGFPGPAAVEPSVAPAPGTALFANHPNPFSGSTTLRFRLGAAGRARLVIYDSSGRLAPTLISGSLSAGEHSVVWDGTDDRGHTLDAGVYFHELRQEGTVARKKMMILR